MAQLDFKTIFRVAARLLATGLFILCVLLLLGVLFFDSLFQIALGRLDGTFNGELKTGQASVRWGGFAVKDIQLNTDDKQPLLEVPEVYFKVSYWDLIRGKGVSAVQEIRWSKPGLRLVVDRLGNLNVTSLLPDVPAETTFLDDFRALVTVEDGWILYRDQRRAGFLYELSGWEGKADFGPAHRAKVHFEFDPRESPDSDIIVQGSLGKTEPQLHLNLKLVDFDLAPFAGYPGFGPGLTYLKGQLSADLTVTGEAAEWGKLGEHIQPVGEVRLAGVNFQSPQMPKPLRDVNGTVRVVGYSVNTDDLRAQVLETPVLVEGKVNLDAAGRVQATVRAPEISLENLTTLFAEPPEVSGRAELDATVQGSLERPRIRGHLSGSDIQVEGLAIKRLETTASALGDSVHVTSLEAETPQGLITGRGWIFLRPTPHLNFSLKGQGADLSGLSEGLASSADFDVKILGTPEKPLVYGEGTLFGINIESLGLEKAGGRFLTDGEDVYVFDGEATQNGSRVRLPVAVLDRSTQEVTGSIESDGFDLRQQSLSATFRGRASFWGDLDQQDSFQARGRLQGASLSDGGYRADDIVGDFVVGSQQVVLPALQARLAGGNFDLSGIFDLSNRVGDLSIQGRGIELRQFGIPGRGPGQVQAQVHGPLDGLAGFKAVVSDHRGRLAASGFRRGNGRVGLVAWLDSDEGRQGRLQGTVAAQGLPDDLSFSYNGQLQGGEALGLELVQVLGDGLVRGGRLKLAENMLTWKNPFNQQLKFPVVRYSGHAYGFFGPTMAAPLQRTLVHSFPYPTDALVRLDGAADISGRRLALNFDASGLDLGWLASRPWLGGDRLNDFLSFEIHSGLGFARGSISGSLSDPVLAGDLRVPWLLLRDTDPVDQRIKNNSAFTLAGDFKMNSEGLRLPRMLASTRAFDSRLPLAVDNPLPRQLGLDMLEVTGMASFDSQIPVDLRLATPGFKTRELALLVPGSVSHLIPYGRVATNNLHLWGPLWRPSASGRVALNDGGIWLGRSSLPLDEVVLDFASQGGEFRIGELKLSSGPVTLTGRGRRRANGSLDGEMWASDIPLSYLHRLGAPWTGLEGDVDLAFSLSGRDEPIVYLAASGEELRWNPRAIGGADQPLTIDEMLFGRADRHEESLTTGPGRGVELKLSRDRLHVSIPDDAARLAFAGAELQAEGAFDVGVPGERDHWKDWFVSQAGPDFGSRGEPFRMSAQKLSRRALERLLGATGSPYTVVASGQAELEGQWYRDHLLAAGDNLPRYSLAFEQLRVEGRDGLGFSGFTLDGDMTASYQRDAQSGNVVLDPMRLVFFRSDRDPENPERQVESEAGKLEAQGRVAIMEAPGSRPTSELRLTARDLPLKNLGFMLPADYQIDGALNSLDFELVGPLLTPRLGILAQFDSARFGALQLAELVVALRGERDAEGDYRLSFSGPDGRRTGAYIGDTKNPQNSLKLDGSIEVDWRQALGLPDDRLNLAWFGRRLRPDSKLAVRGELVDQELKFVANLLPPEARTAGVLKGDLAIEGTLNEPKLAGNISLENGLIDHPSFGVFSELNMATRFEKIPLEEAEPLPPGQAPPSDFISRYSIERFQGRLGGQPFKMEGKAELAGIDPTFIDVRVQGDELPLRYPDLLDARATIDLALRGRLGYVAGESTPTLVPLVDGSIVIPSGDLTLPVGALGGEAAATSTFARFPLKFDVALTLGDNFWARALDSRVRAQGDLRVVSGENNQPLLAGALYLSRGNIKIPFYDASFRLRQGWAYWERSVIPELENVEAVTDLGGYRVIAVVNGTYPDIDLQLVSDPPLPQAELSRLVVLGGLPSAFNNQQVDNATSTQGFQGFLASQGVSFISGILTNRLTEEIGRLLFLSEVSFEYIPPASYSVKLAKALDRRDDFLLTLTRIIRENGIDENLFGLEWRFLPNLLVRTAFDTFARPRIWFQSITRF